MRATRSWIVLMLAILVATVGACGGAAEPFGRPADLGDGWETATLEEVGLEAEPFRNLVEVVEDEPARAVHGILVVRDGRLVFEQYFAGYRFDYDGPGFRGEAVEYDATNRHNLMSITKAVTGAVVGIAVDDGDIDSVDSPMLTWFGDYADEDDPHKDEITVEHLLTMTSGLEWNEWDVPLTDTEHNDLIQLFVVDDPVEYILAKPVIHDPGSYWYYSGGGVNLLGELVERATGTTIDEFAQTELFEPLGITDVRWSEVNTDMVDASGELELRPRDLAKFGQLYLDDGVWNGAEVIPGEWIEASLAEHIAIPGRSADGHGYGYQWFIQTFEHDGEHLDAAVRTGWGGQALALFPSLDTLVVVTGGDYVQQSFVSELIGTSVIPAIAGQERDTVVPLVGREPGPRRRLR